jgi:predicted 3-demethylubiquinone-9 3-methyltransferase (glyoxalase superfamily)
LVKADKKSESGILPDEKMLTDMGKFNEELADAGIILAGEGLHPSLKGKRVRFSGKKRMVIDGPFSNINEIVAGFWIWKVASMDEAVSFYTSTFEHSHVENIVPYEKSEGQYPEAIKHAAFFLDDNRFIMMDSGVDHQFEITPAVSFMVNCRDQQEIDLLWKRLSAVPEAEQCGWLQDRYGVSWQITPAFLGDLVQDEDPVGDERMMEVLIPMKKLDYAALMRAYGG